MDNKCGACGVGINSDYGCADCIGINFPTISRADLLKLPRGTSVGGLAPIGIRWHATVSKRSDGTPYLKPADGCPPNEFAPTHVRINGKTYEVA